jgi:hypothetical protein
MTRGHRRYFSIAFIILAYLALVASNDDVDDRVDDHDHDVCTGTNDAASETCQNGKPKPKPPRVPDSCGIVMAQSSLPNAGWGVFSMVDRQKGTEITRGDIVIQITDPNPEHHLNGMKLLVDEYAWQGQDTGGQFEGTNVLSLVPGLGMIANSYYKHHNILPLAPQVDEGGLTRFDSPGAGAITHYHNYSWFAQKELYAGDELFVSKPEVWYEERNYLQVTPTTDAKPSLESLREHGYCLDNLLPRKSNIKEGGRGAFATRKLEEGTIVAPVPVLPINASSLEKGVGAKTDQLLRNYCFGHKDSSLLLYSYSSMVHLINHYTEPNVKLRWSEASAELVSKPFDSSRMDQPLLLELVAARTIQPGDEIYLDYGHDWETAWWWHVKHWKPADEHYIPSYVMDDASRMIRTEKEQKEYPYPDNVQMSCFYRYSDRNEREKSTVQSESVDAVYTYRWSLTKGLFDLQNIRPCSVLRRNEDPKGRWSAYAVRMFNRPGLAENEMIPKSQLHIVTHVPRSAIRFVDVQGTTDQHLEGAFRKEIGLDVFPKEWTDLATDSQ